MQEHIDSHDNAQVADTNTVYAGQNQTGQVQVAANQNDDEIITWEASEYVHYDKGPEWFITIFSVGLLLAIGVYFIVDIFSASIVLFMTIALLVYGKYKPRNLRYTISSHGISVGDSDYKFSEFRSFSVMDNEGIHSIFLVPMQRFMVPITIYVAPENQDQIIDTLSQFLPHQQRELDLLDKITAKFRF